MGVRRRYTRRTRHTRGGPTGQDKHTLPCGCDADELAQAMGISRDELLSAAARGHRPDAHGDGPALVTAWFGPQQRHPHRPDDDVSRN